MQTGIYNTVYCRVLQRHSYKILAYYSAFKRILGVWSGCKILKVFKFQADFKEWNFTCFFLMENTGFYFEISWHRSHKIFSFLSEPRIMCIVLAGLETKIKRNFVLLSYNIQKIFFWFKYLPTILYILDVP